jgi:hypothetical protein
LLDLKTPLGAEIVTHRNSTNRNSIGGANASDKKSPAGDEDITDSFGTLKINEAGEMRFFGVTAGSEWFLEQGEPDSNPWTMQPPELSHLAHSFPFSTLNCNTVELRRQLKTFLPPVEQGWSLCQSYFDYGAWMYQPFTRKFFIEKIFTPIYHPGPSAQAIPPQNLALLFIVLAIGVSVDRNRPPYQPEAEQYHLLSRACMALECAFAHASIAGVQTLMLMCFFNQLTFRKVGPPLTWAMMGLAMKMATSIGLHRDGQSWGLEEEDTEIRRLVFWEMVCFDLWSAQGFGRPPSINLNHTDCKLPMDPEEKIGSNGQTEPSYYRLKYTYSEMLLGTLNEAFGAERPSYDTILKLDKRIRDFNMPASMQVPGLDNMHASVPGSLDQIDLTHSMQRHALFCNREVTLLHLHRSFFARALSDHPTDPFQSKYAPSVLAAHRSSCHLIAAVGNLFRSAPSLVPRFWFFWVHAFSASVALASIVIKSPSCNLAPSSLRELDTACELFRQASDGCRPARSLPALRRLQTKAHATFQQFLHGHLPPSAPPSTGPSHSTPNEEADEMAMLGGKTRLVSAKRNGSISSPPANQVQPSPLPSSSDSPPILNSENVHPALVNYLRAYHASVSGNGGGRATDGQSTPLEQPDFLSHQSYGGYTVHTSPGSVNSPSLPFSHHRTPSSQHTTPLVSPVLQTPQTYNFFPSSSSSHQQPPMPLSSFPAFPQMSVNGAVIDPLSNDCLPGAESSNTMIMSGGTGELDVTWQRFMTDMGLST